MKYRVKGTKRLTIAFASIEIINHLNENDKCKYFLFVAKTTDYLMKEKNENKYTCVIKQEL